MSHSFSNRYCPICLMKVNPKDGSHWDFCEYEASCGVWVNPQQPLTETEMLKKKLRNNEKELIKINHRADLLKEIIADLKSDIEKSGKLNAKQSVQSTLLSK